MTNGTANPTGAAQAEAQAPPPVSISAIPLAAPALLKLEIRAQIVWQVLKALFPTYPFDELAEHLENGRDKEATEMLQKFMAEWRGTLKAK